MRAYDQIALARMNDDVVDPHRRESLHERPPLAPAVRRNVERIFRPQEQQVAIAAVGRDHVDIAHREV